MTATGLAPVRAAEAVVAGAGSSFYWAMRLLPRERREAMYAVYAFCRRVDDIADGSDPPTSKRAALARWREEIDALFAGNPRDPLAHALAGPVARFGLRREELLAVIEGMEMDAAGTMVAPDWPTLERYCDCVAGAVGRLSVRIFGVPEAEGPSLARALGLAVQLTNILRDVQEDARDGRLYLPRGLLTRHSIPSTPADAVAHPALGKAGADLAARARAEFATAEAILARVPRGAGRPVRIMAAVYRRLLDRIERQGYAPGLPRARVGRAEKLWIALSHSWR